MYIPVVDADVHKNTGFGQLTHLYMLLVSIICSVYNRLYCLYTSSLSTIKCGQTHAASVVSDSYDWSSSSSAEFNIMSNKRSEMYNC